MTPAEAQAEIRSIAEEFLVAEDRLRRVRAAVPRSADEDAMFEGLLPWDLATEIRTVIECIMERDIRPAVTALERLCRATEEILRKQFRP